MTKMLITNYVLLVLGAKTLYFVIYQTMICPYLLFTSLFTSNVDVKTHFLIKNILDTK